ncbi:DUF1799 domain-containing protein [Variovorax sp.]|uniref:DUF1799 domain-containing protein n=1 Tax=Variovorax sp. TaxID=1871043 RepID=UPI003BAAC918
MVDAQLTSQCALLGIDVDQLMPRDRQLAVVPDYELWPEHEDAWFVYLGCSSQWRIAAGFGVAVWLGLDYAGVRSVMSMYGVAASSRREVFQQLQVLEDEELRLRNGL